MRLTSSGVNYHGGMRFRPTVLATLIASALLLGSCTRPGPHQEAPQPERGRAQISEQEEELAVINGTEGEMALAVSQALFDSAPTVVTAPGEDSRAQDVGAEIATEIGAPMLLASGAESDGADPGRKPLLAELERLGAETLLWVGQGPGQPEDGPWEVVPVDPDAEETPPEAAEDVHGEPVTNAAAIVTDSPQSAAAKATAEAAGVPLAEVAGADPNPQASTAAIEFLTESDAAAILAIGTEFEDPGLVDWQVRSAGTGYELPGGGQLVLGPRQYVALYGTPGASDLGALGHQDLDEAVERVQELGAEYQALADRKVVASFEIIATIASGEAGDDGNYSSERALEDLRPWVERAGEEGMVVILDLQPGRTDFLTQAKEYEELLKLPHVGLALDPEWRLTADQEHLAQIGSVSAGEVNEVVHWLADLTNEEGLPPKMLVLHEFRTSMITHTADVDLSRPEVDVLIHAEGQGTQSAKQETWRALHAEAPEGIGWGWKNFLEKDSPTLTPEQTVSEVDPVPDLVTYQ